MTQDRWLQLLADIKESFTVVEEDEWLEEEERGGTHYQTIVFESPIGVLKLELSDRPKVVDRHTNYSNRIGADVSMEYTYSPNEKIYELLAWRWSDDEEDWFAIDLEKLNFSNN